jgi:hypothetical protein
MLGQCLGDFISLESNCASFDFAQDEAIFLMPSTVSPLPELVEGRRLPMQRTFALTMPSGRPHPR